MTMTFLFYSLSSESLRRKSKYTKINNLLLVPYIIYWWIHYHKLIKGDLRTICRFSYIKVYKLITLGTKFKTLLSLGKKITMFSKFITNYIEQGWWHSSLTLKCMHLLLKEVNKRGRHAYNLHGWTCLPSGIVMEIHCHITGIFEAAILLFSVICSWFSKVLLFVFVTKINSQTFNATWLIYVPPKVNL